MRKRYSGMVLALLFSANLLACSSVEEKHITPDAGMVEQSRDAAKSLLTQLGATLKQELSTNGPVAAVGVCKQVAPAIAADVSQKTGMQVGRVGTRVRDTALGTPDAWEQAALTDFAARLAKGESAEKMEFTQVVTEPTGKYLRYAKAITVQPMCLTCHGPAANIPDGVKERLAVDYPNDKATGYNVGDLRGAVVVKRAL
ncbi:MAG: DUF3365 domain-containing protein [Sulfuriferula sp.]|nr:DUF3365 domain-containing protein [Sulfuriferula sp.]